MSTADDNCKHFHTLQLKQSFNQMFIIETEHHFSFCNDDIRAVTVKEIMQLHWR